MVGICLERISSKNQEQNITYLPQNWVFIEKDTGKILSASKYINSDADYYGFDAFRTMWRIALDARWFNEPKANEYLENVSTFFVNKWDRDKQYFAIYDLQGNPQTPYGTFSSNTRRDYHWTVDTLRQILGPRWTQYAKSDDAAVRSRMQEKDEVGVALEVSARMKEVSYVSFR